MVLTQPIEVEQTQHLIQQIYAIERQAREQNLRPEQCYQLHQDKTVPIMDEQGQRMIDEYPNVLPKSTIGKALYHLIGRNNKIYFYLQNCRLEIDNNLIENSIRSMALGRKHYLFAGSNACQ